MDRRSLVAILLALTTYYAWTLWVQSTQPPAPIEDTDATTAEAPARPGEPVAAAAPEAPVPREPSRHLGPVRTADLNWCTVQTTWSTEHGAMTSAMLSDYESPWEVTPLWSWAVGLVTGGSSSGWSPYGAQPGEAVPLAQPSLAVTAGAGAFDRPPAQVQLVEQASDRLVMVGPSDGLDVRKVVSVGQDCALDVEVTWTNRTGATYTGGLWTGLHSDLPEDTSRYKPSMRPFAYVDEDLEEETDLEDLREAAIPYDGGVDWFGVADSYFAAVMLPADPAGRVLLDAVSLGESTVYGGHHVIERSLAPGEAFTSRYRVYIGPKDADRLAAVDETLTESIQLGFFGFFGKILLWLLHFFHDLVGNWGVAIIFLTVSVKMIFFPLTQMSFKSSQAMSALQPELQEIREKYKDDPEELNRRMLKLWKDNGVNPAGGCLPMLVQFPVWISLYQVLLSSVDLYHTEFLYLRDLSSVDPYCVLPAITVGLMALQQRMMPMSNMDPTQARIMKLMPLIFGVFFFTFPSGLVVYIFVNMVLTILQQWVIKRTYKPAAKAA